MTPKTILVPIDFSTCAEHALDYACGGAEKLGSTIHLVNAIGAAPSIVRDTVAST